jgi:hypothetical protein
MQELQTQQEQKQPLPQLMQEKEDLQKQTASRLQPLPGKQPSSSLFSSSQTSLRVGDLQEITDWNWLEEMFEFHDAIRYYHEVPLLRMNRTVRCFTFSLNSFPTAASL